MSEQSTSKPMVYPLFSSPVYARNLGDFDVPDIEALDFSSTLPDGASHPFLTSKDKRILERDDFRHLNRLILDEIGSYVHGALGVKRSIEFYVTNSWININRPGDQCFPHAHNNSLISGVLYLKAPQNCGDLFFYRDTLSLVPFPPALDLETQSQNIFNSKHFGITPKTFDICLFPSVLMHSAGVNASEEDRWCLPFNTFVRGDIGGLHELTLR